MALEPQKANTKFDGVQLSYTSRAIVICISRSISVFAPAFQWFDSWLINQQGARAARVIFCTKREVKPTLYITARGAAKLVYIKKAPTISVEDFSHKRQSTTGYTYIQHSQFDGSGNFISMPRSSALGEREPYNKGWFRKQYATIKVSWALDSTGILLLYIEGRRPMAERENSSSVYKELFRKGFRFPLATALLIYVIISSIEISDISAYRVYVNIALYSWKSLYENTALEHDEIFNFLPP